jgi:hypothetical protein
MVHCEDLRVPLRPGLSDRTSTARIAGNSSEFPIAGYGLERRSPA